MDPRSSLKAKSSRRVSSFTAEMPLIWLIGASNLPSPVMTRTFLPLYHWNTSGCILTNTKNLSTCWFTKSSSNCMIFQINAPTQSFGRFLPLFFRACYMIYDNDGNSFPDFCDLKSEPGIAWTLVMSWSRENRVISASKNAVLQVNAPENENSPNYDRLAFFRVNIRLKWVIIPFCRCSKILREAGKQEILQQMFRKF